MLSSKNAQEKLENQYYNFIKTYVKCELAFKGSGDESDSNFLQLLMHHPLKPIKNFWTDVMGRPTLKYLPTPLFISRGRSVM